MDQRESLLDRDRSRLAGVILGHMIHKLVKRLRANRTVITNLIESAQKRGKINNTRSAG